MEIDDRCRPPWAYSRLAESHGVYCEHRGGEEKQNMAPPCAGMEIEEAVGGDADGTGDHGDKSDHAHRVEPFSGDQSGKCSHEYGHGPNHYGADVGSGSELHSCRADQQEGKPRSAD